MLRTILTGAACAAFAISGPALADNFFDGKTVRVVVPSGSGGTYHLYCQILARHLGEHLGDGTNVVTQNMPGAGGVKATRYMLNAAPKDGSYIAMINPGSIALPGLREDVGFDTRKLDWLGSMSGRAYSVGVFHESGIKSVEDAKKREVIMGTTGKASTSYLIPAFMNATLGTKFKIITGYKGGGAINLAIQKKEIEGRGNFYTGYLGVWPEAVSQGQMNFIARLGPDRPDMKDIPTLRSMLKTQRHMDMLDILEVNFNVGQAFYAPNDLPDGRLETLREAFWDTVKDEATIKEAASRHLPMRSQKPEQVLEAINDVFTRPPEAFAELADMLGFKSRKK